MTRRVAAAVAVAGVAGAGVMIGGRSGIIAAAIALVLLAAGLLLGSPWLVTAGPAVQGGAYLAPLVLFHQAVDPEAPLLALLLFAALEAGHLALEGARYDLPGGRRVLLRRLVFLGGIMALAFAAGWVTLLTGGLPLPALAGTAVGAAALLGLMWFLRLLRPSGDVQAYGPGA